MHTPSNACRRSRSPSTMRTWMRSVSPGAKSGIDFFSARLAAVAASNCWILFIALSFPFLLRSRFGRPRREISRPQIRPPLRRRFLRLLASPAADHLVMAGKQNLRHPASLPVGGPRVMRVFEQTRLETLLVEPLGRAQHTRQEPYHRIDQRDCRGLAARQHEIAEAYQLQRPRLDHPFVDAFV